MAKANEFAKDGNLKDAVAALLPLEKATRVAQDAPACTKVVLGITTICFDDPTDGFQTAISTVTMLAKRRSALQTPILKMVQKAMDYIEKSPSEERKVALIEALRAVTEGKIFLELESARLTRQLAAIKEKNGDIAEAATIMQETAVETIGSMEGREKTDFILEQIRLCLAKKDYVRADIIGKKIKRDRLDDPEESLLMTALRDMNLSKMVAQDVPLFLSLISDLFPAQQMSNDLQHMDVRNALVTVVEKGKLIHHPSWTIKVIQL